MAPVAGEEPRQSQTLKGIMKNSRIIVVRYDEGKQLFVAKCGKVSTTAKHLRVCIGRIIAKMNKFSWDCRISIPKASDIYR